MTPREADVAFVLEDVDDVLGVYAIDAPPERLAYYRFAVHLTDGYRALARAHYTLLRVMSHEECEGVNLFHTALPPAFARSARLLHLTDRERAAARLRVPPPPPLGEMVTVTSKPITSVLVVDPDPDVAALVKLFAEGHALVEVVTRIEVAEQRLALGSFGLVFCSAELALGAGGLLARLPLDVACRVVVLVQPEAAQAARVALRGQEERIVLKPLNPSRVYDWVRRARVTSVLWGVPDTTVAAGPPRRQLPRPADDAPFSFLLVDLDEDVAAVFRRVAGVASRYAMQPTTAKAAKQAFASPFHAIACSPRVAFGPQGLLETIAREDPAAAERVLVAAPPTKHTWVRSELARAARKNVVLASPVDDVALRSAIVKQNPAFAARLAVADVPPALLPAARPRFRRLAVLVVDDDPSTAILLRAAEAHAGADVVHADSPFAAFERVTSRPVDVLVVSATMRADGGEPLHRLLWRIAPSLKARSMLIAGHAGDAPPSTSRLLVVRPLTRDVIAGVVATFA